MYDVATQHGRVVFINCHDPHEKKVKEYVAQLRMEYVRAPERALVIVVGDYNHGPQRQGVETEEDWELRLFLEEMRLQDMSYNSAPGPSHYPAPEGSTASRIDAVYANPQCFCGVRAGYTVGPEEIWDKKGHCPKMVAVEVKVGEPGDDEDAEQEADDEGVNPPSPVK